MNILFLSHQSEHVFGGEIVSLEMMQEMQKRGDRVFLATPRGKLYDLASSLGIETLAIDSIEFSRNIEIVPEFILCWCKTHLALMQFARKHEVNLIHAISGKAMVYAWWGAFFRPVVWHHHNIMVRTLGNRFWLNILAFQASRILVPSNATRVSLLENSIPAEKVLTMYNGFSVEKWPSVWESRKATGKTKPFRIGFVGEISRRKGVDILIQVTRALKEKASLPFEVLIFGEPAKEKHFADQVRLDAERLNEIKFMGRTDKVTEAYAQFDVVVVPSRQDPLPTVIIEAFLSCLPVLAPRVGGIPEMIKDGESGYLCDRVDEYVDKILHYMSDPELLREQGEAARMLAVKRFSITSVGDTLDQVYREVLHRYESKTRTA